MSYTGAVCPPEPGNCSVANFFPLRANFATRNVDPSVSSISEYVVSLGGVRTGLPRFTTTMSRAGMDTLVAPAERDPLPVHRDEFPVDLLAGGGGHVVAPRPGRRQNEQRGDEQRSGCGRAGESHGGSQGAELGDDVPGAGIVRPRTKKRRPRVARPPLRVTRPEHGRVGGSLLEPVLLVEGLEVVLDHRLELRRQVAGQLLNDLGPLLRRHAAPLLGDYGAPSRPRSPYRCRP